MIFFRESEGNLNQDSGILDLGELNSRWRHNKIQWRFLDCKLQYLSIPEIVKLTQWIYIAKDRFDPLVEGAT